MQPNSPLGQISQSMSQGQPELNQISNSSPAGQPGLQPPNQPPMPNRFDLIHSAAARRGMNLQGHPQLQQGQSQQPQMAPQAPQSPQPSPGDGQVEMPISEAELIIKALTTRMKTISGHEEKLRDAAISMLLPETAQAQGE